MRSRLYLAASVLGVAALCAVLPASRAGAQVSTTSRVRSGRDFPAARFEPISRTAAYLAAYDQVAWITTDSLVALVRRDTALRHVLGAEWFAFEQDSTWHAVYGRYDQASDRYIQAAHFAAPRGGKFRRQATPADSLLARRYGRALSLTAARLPAAARDTRARFNTYVRPASGGELELWYLPAWQQNGWIIHGMEFYFRVDSTGRRILDSSAVVSALRGSPPDTNQVIDIFNGERELPTVGQAFFAMSYGRYFKNVFIRNRDFVSTFFNAGGSPAWVHALGRDLDDSPAAADSTH